MHIHLDAVLDYISEYKKKINGKGFYLDCPIIRD